MEQKQVHIGAQGWNYDDWVGPFYPRGTRSAEYLDLYAKAFDTVEIDSTWYAIPAEAAVAGWRNRAPAGFTYSLKLPQEITHRRRLHDSQEILDRFCARARELDEKLALILIQMPPDFSPLAFNALAQFLPLLAVPLILILFPEEGSKYWCWTIGIYGLAKLCDFGDAGIWKFTYETFSGHSLKHILAAAALIPLLSVTAKMHGHDAGQSEFGTNDAQSTHATSTVLFAHQQSQLHREDLQRKVRRPSMHR